MISYSILHSERHKTSTLNLLQSFVVALAHRIECAIFVLLQLNVVDGKKQYLFDGNGRRYLDAFGGIATVCCGHCHPDVVEAIVNQTKRLQHSTIVYLNHNIAEFAEALASKLPGDLKVYLFMIELLYCWLFSFPQCHSLV